MVQKEVSLVCVFAFVCWSLAVIFTVLSLRYPNHGLDTVMVLFTGAAATLHIRSFVNDLKERERRAFELGRDSGMRAVR